MWSCATIVTNWRGVRPVDTIYEPVRTPPLSSTSYKGKFSDDGPLACAFSSRQLSSSGFNISLRFENQGPTTRGDTVDSVPVNKLGFKEVIYTNEN